MLRCERQGDLRELTLKLTAPMLVMSGIDIDEVTATKHLERLLDSGHAYEKFIQLVEAQGGDPRAVQPPYALPVASRIFPITASQTGYIKGIDPMIIGLTGIDLGAGRIRQEDSIDPGVGFKFIKRTGDYVQAGDILVDVYANRELDSDQLLRISSAFEYQVTPTEIPNLIYERILP